MDVRAWRGHSCWRLRCFLVESRADIVVVQPEAGVQLVIVVCRVCAEPCASCACLLVRRTSRAYISICKLGFSHRGRGGTRGYPMEERVSRFYSWVSTYYSLSDLTRTTRDPALLHTAPQPYPAPPSVRSATLDSISLEAIVVELN